ncbi:MAG: hypothetical protein V4713_18320, partial [Pseudomonadota bacterium]
AQSNDWAFFFACTLQDWPSLCKQCSVYAASAARSSATPDIQVEVHKGSITITVNWTLDGATSCAAGMISHTACHGRQCANLMNLSAQPRVLGWLSAWNVFWG